MGSEERPIRRSKTMTNSLACQNKEVETRLVHKSKMKHFLFKSIIVFQLA